MKNLYNNYTDYKWEAENTVLKVSTDGAHAVIPVGLREKIETIKSTKEEQRMNIEKNEYIESLEKRIERLENIIEHLVVQDGKEINMTHCPIGDITLGANCNITLNSCPVGAVVSDIEDAEDRLDDLECRLDELLDNLDNVESSINSKF